MNSKKLFHQAWILSDGKIGDLVQCEGVAQALSLEAETRIVSPGWPWAWMMPYGPVPIKDQIDNPDSPIHGSLPDLVIASGWRTLAYIREIKKRQKGAVFTVFLKSPRIQANYLDLIWVPAHDTLRGDRIISSIPSPHRFSPHILAQEYGERPEILGNLSCPLVGVLLGGESKDYRFTDADCQRIAGSLRAIAETGAGLAITPSRRSSDRLKEMIKQQLSDLDYYWWDEISPNPYGYLLSQSDAFVVTADSANMVGEACVTGKPIYVFKPTGGSKKFDRMLERIAEYGATKPLPEKMTELVPWNYEPLYAAENIAQEIEQRATRQFANLKRSDQE